MTAQASDTLVYEGRDYSLVAMEKDWPFKPQDHGFEPRGRNSACRRGYVCRYSVANGALLLTQLNVALGPAEPPSWRGIRPKQTEFFRFDETWEYAGVDMPIVYSGGVIAGRDFIREFYVHMGFHRPHCFRTVVGLIFEEGQLKQALDHSEKMERVRDRIREHRGAPGTKPSREDIEQFVEDAFSLSYEKKWSR